VHTLSPVRVMRDRDTPIGIMEVHMERRSTVLARMRQLSSSIARPTWFCCFQGYDLFIASRRLAFFAVD
jgi:hypothetical protein